MHEQRNALKLSKLTDDYMKLRYVFEYAHALDRKVVSTIFMQWHLMLKLSNLEIFILLNEMIVEDLKNVTFTWKSIGANAKE